MPFQRGAARAAEGLEVRQQLRHARQSLIVEMPEDGELDGAGDRPVHHRPAFEARDFIPPRQVGPPRLHGRAAKTTCASRMERVQELPAGGGIGAEMVRVRREAGMDRAENQRRRPLIRRLHRKLREGRKIADAEIARAAQGVKLDGEAPEAGILVARRVSHAEAPFPAQRRG